MASINGSSRAELNALSATLADTWKGFAERYHGVRNHLDSLAKPVGSLGSVEDFAARVAAAQRSSTPSADNAVCLIFAADHGVAKDGAEGGENCSSYPQAVTRKVLEGLDHGIAGANVLARSNDVVLRVIDVGLEDGPAEYEWSNKVVRDADKKVKGGTKNFCMGDAMSKEEVKRCIDTGRDEAEKFIDEYNASIIVFGEVGIGNTTTSSALIAALNGVDAESLCIGTGASPTRDGVDDAAVAKKVSIIKKAMEFHKEASLKGNPLEALRAVGGAEIAAIVGGMLHASTQSVPIVVDGFIVTTAAMIACQIDPMLPRLLLFATRSTEKGQAIALETIGEIAKTKGLPPLVSPALDMNLRMGEGTGALLAVPIIRSSCKVLSELATLNEVLGLKM